MVLVNFWRYPDPYQRFLIPIRIRIRPNDTDPTGSGSGSGSETLVKIILSGFHSILYCRDTPPAFTIRQKPSPVLPYNTGRGS